MTHADLIAGAVIIAVLAALVADVAAFGARRDAARALLSAHTHPKRSDPPAPRNLAVDRRLADQGPPRGQPDRRRHRAPDDERATRRGGSALREGTREFPAVGVAHIAPGHHLEAGADGVPRVVADELPTEELHPPTRDVRAVRPDQQP